MTSKPAKRAPLKQRTTGGSSEPRVVLDPSSEFEKCLIDVVEMHRLKSRAYGTSDNAFQNFFDIAYNNPPMTPLQACEVLLGKHHAALKQAKMKGVGHTSTTDDAYLDRAVYSILALVLYNRESAD